MAAKAELDKKYLKEEEHEKLPDGNKRYTICGMRFETTPNYAVRILSATRTDTSSLNSLIELQNAPKPSSIKDALVPVNEP